MDSNSKLIREMVMRADMRLQAQQQIALAADARAMQFTVICIAAASLTATLAQGTEGWAHYVISGLLVIAALCSFWAARPVDWNAPGMHASAFLEDLETQKDFDEVLRELAGHLDDAMRENDDILSENAAALRYGTLIAIMSPVIGICMHFTF